jgi:hypothetical protein
MTVTSLDGQVGTVGQVLAEARMLVESAHRDAVDLCALAVCEYRPRREKNDRIRNKSGYEESLVLS